MCTSKMGSSCACTVASSSQLSITPYTPTLQPMLRLPRASLFKNTQATVMAPHIPQTPLSIDAHLAYARTLGRQWEGTHLACLRVQADDRICSKLVGPHDASAIHRYGLRTAIWTAWQDVLVYDFGRHRVNVQQCALAVERHPQRAVWRCGHPAWLRASFQGEFGDSPGFGI